VRILVTGGAGYIGSHMAHHLIDDGHSVVVVDNLSTGVRELVPDEAEFHELDVRESVALEKLMASENVDGVLHFAASTVVPESVARPLDYYDNNIVGSLSLLQAMASANVSILVFSSTAAVYGMPSNSYRITEEASVEPVSPYGASKLVAERMITDAAAAHGLQFAILRYFNVAGADPQGRTGQSTPHATHLIKVACEAAIGKRDGLTVFGTDYPTRDGTCIRDYIHVWDLVRLHQLALDHLVDGRESLVVNCGYSRGHSVNEVVTAVERVAGTRVAVTPSARRPGDVAAVVAVADRAREILGWRPQYADLDQIVGHALAWERRLPTNQPNGCC
jgi:UDP-glucose 4-epimerase